MDLQIETEVVGDTLLATCTGTATLDSAVRLLKDVCSIAAEKRVQKVLFNGLGVSGVLSAFERYELGVQVSEHLRQHNSVLRLAFVGIPPTFNGFGALVARNREVVTDVFPTAEQAAAWLSRWPNLPNTDGAK